MLLVNSSEPGRRLLSLPSRRVAVLISLAILALLLAACANGLKVKVETDCLWYQVPPPLTAGSIDYIEAAPADVVDNLGAYFNAVEDNVDDSLEFCK